MQAKHVLTVSNSIEPWATALFYSILKVIE